MKPQTLLFALCGLLLVARAARAYSDPSQFVAPVLEAGGGGRFYTGSPAEGYGCSSCHSGGAQPKVEVSGLPQRYVPRATYELRVSWPRSLEHVAMTLELTDERGRGVGDVTLPAPGTYERDEQCEPADGSVLATQLYAADRDRTIVAAPDCGASTVRVQWTAPSTRVGPVWLAVVVLESNHDGDFTGDGVTELARAFPPFGETLPPVVTVGSCDVAGDLARPAQRARVLGCVSASVMLGCVRARVRKRRTAR